MVKTKSKNSFTLVELLVVVLIIAVLAAIAIPQYQIFRYKILLGEVAPTVEIIANAKKMYRLRHGNWGGLTYDIEECFAGRGYEAGSTEVQQELDIEIPETSNFVYLIAPWSGVQNPTDIYFRDPNHYWAWAYDYNTDEWTELTGGNGGLARRYFRPPR